MLDYEGKDLRKEKLSWMYRKMVEIRRFEEGIADLYHRGLVPNGCLLYTGQEAIAAGVCANLREDDYILSTHRAHGHCITKGVPLDRLAAEILGRATGLCGGRGGSMRPVHVKSGVLGSCAIVGANIPIATGVGLSIKVRKTDQVVACFFGEGASNIGGFHEGLNLASLWRLPVIFVCENNRYAISTSVTRSTSVENISDRAKGYSMPGISIDGNDVTAVYEAAKEAVERARKGNGPTLMECKTYRWSGHHEGDPGTYRPREEVREWMEKDPIKRLRTRMLESSLFREEDLKAIEKETEIKVEEALKFAVESPFPSPETLMEQLF